MMFNWWTFLFETLNFVVLAYVLHRLLYRPLRAAIDKRREANARAQSEAEQARRAAEELRAQLQEQLSQLDRERQELIRTAREQADAQRQQLLAAAQQTIQRQLDEARQALERERAEALKALQGELMDQAVALARRLLAESCDRSLQQQLALRLVQSLEQLSDEEKRSLRAGCQPGESLVLESADGVDASTLARLNAAAAAIVGRPAEVTVEQRPELIGGVRLRLAGQVWDASLAGQLSAAQAATTPEATR